MLRPQHQGIFTSGSSRIVADADRLLDFALGRTDVEPVLTELSFSPHRVKEWLDRWLARAGMKIVADETRQAGPLPDTRDPGAVLDFCRKLRSDDAVRRVARAAARS